MNGQRRHFSWAALFGLLALRAGVAAAPKRQAGERA